MDGFLMALGILLGLVALAWLLVGPIVTLMLFARIRRLERKIGLGAHELAPAELPRRRPATAGHAVDERATAPEPADIVDVVEAVEPDLVTPPPRPSRPPGEASSWEELVAGKWLTWVGAVAVVIGVGFFFKYAIDQGWIGPTARVVLGILAGMLCFAGGALAVLRNYRFFGQGLVGAALGILYFSLFAGFAWYHSAPGIPLIPQGVAFAGMVLVTAAALAFSAYFNAQPTAILGLLGGFLTPVMLSTGEDAQWALFSYIFILDVGVLGVATFRKWQPLQALAFFLTLVIWAAWFEKHYEPAKLGSTVILMTAFFLLFALLGVWYNVLRRKPAQPADFFLILATPVAYFIGLYAVTQQHYGYLQGLLAVGLAGTYLGLGVFALSRNPAGKSVVVSLAGIAAAFLTVAIPLQLTGHWIAIAWAAESLLLVELGLRFNEIKLRWAGFALLTVVQLILLYYAGATMTDPGQFQTRFTRGDPIVEEVSPFPVAPASTAAAVPPSAWKELFNGRAFSFLASAIVLGVMAREYRRRPATAPAAAGRLAGSATNPEWWIAGGLLAAVPVTVLAMFLLETFAVGQSAGWLFPTFLGLFSVWTALTALVVVALAVTWGPPWLARVGIGIFGLLAFFLLISFSQTLGSWRSDWQQLSPHKEESIWNWVLVNPRGFGFLCAMGSAVAGAILLRRAEQAQPGLGFGPTAPVTPGTVLGVFAYLTALAMLTLEVYTQGVIRDWDTATSLAVTVVWTLFAVGTLVAGIYYRSAAVRILALSVLGLTTCKVFFYDVWQLETTIRTLAFVALGVALLLASYLYRRYRDRVRAWITPVALAGLLLNGWALASPAARAADGPPELVRILTHRWPVQPPEGKAGAVPNKEQALFRLPVPPDLYGFSQLSLGDVRILAVEEPQGPAAEIPYVLFQPADSSTFVRRPAPLLNLSQLEGNTQFLLDLGDARETINELDIEVSDADRNYERSVKVYGSDRRDANEWNLLTKDAYLLDVTRPEHRLTTGKVAFPQSRFHFYKVVIENHGQPALHITGAKVYDRKQVQAPRRQYPGEILSQNNSAKDKTSTVIVDLRYDRLPTLALHVETAFTGSFYRPASLEVGDSLKRDSPWHPLASGQLYRIDRPGLKASGMDFTYPQSPGRYLRLTINNGDDQPLQVKSCTASGIDKYLVAEGLLGAGRSTGVYSGNAALPAPRYDLARTIGDLSVENLPELQLDPVETNPLYAGPTPPELPWSEKNKPLLWMATLAGVLVLGLLTFLLLRQAAKTGPGSGGE